MKKKSLRRQLLVGNTIIFIVILILFGGVIYGYNYQVLVKNINQHNQHITKDANERISNYLAVPRQMIDQMRHYIVESDDGTNLEITKSYFQTLVEVYSYITDIMLIDKNGNIELSAPEKPGVIGMSVVDEDFYRNKPTEHGTYWSNLYVSAETGSPTLTMTVAAGDKLIVCNLDLAILDEVVQEPDGDAFISAAILDSFGTYVVAPDPKMAAQRLRHPDFELIKAAVEQDVLEIVPPNQKDVLFTVSQIGIDKNWYFVIAEDRRILYKPLRDLAETLVAVILLIGTSAFAFIYLYLAGVMEDLGGLIHHTLLISEGQYDCNSQVSQFQEFQELSDHFSTMVGHVGAREEEITSLNESLEELIDERTMQLQETNAQLEETNAQLEEEAMEGQRSREEIARINETLEKRVKERTEELEWANENLEEINIQLEEEVEKNQRTVALLEAKEIELEKAVRIAEDANLSKSQFLANMSHEIRTPMNGILGMLSVLAMTGINKEQEGYLRTVQSSADTLLIILNDILDYSKIEAGKVLIRHESFNLEETLSDIHHLFTATAEHKDVVLSVEMDDSLPRVVMGDENRVRQILSNLVGNAIKFTTQGSVSLAVSAEWQDESITRFRFEVTDTGIGIEPEDLPSLFDRFTQLGNQDGKKTTGTGLGLAISKMLVSLMDGQIGVRSRRWFGSTFYFILTLKTSTVGSELKNRKEYKQNMTKIEDLAGLKILVVEDDPTSLKIMKLMLEKFNAQVACAENGIKALTALSKQSYDMVLMDVNMPEMDGLSASRKVRALGMTDRNSKPLTIVAMTAYAMGGDKDKCIDAGMTDYLSKPVKLDKLLEKIHRYWTPETDGIFVARKVADIAYNIEDRRNNQGSVVYEQALNAFMQASGLDEDTCIFVLRTYLEQSKDLLLKIRNDLKNENYLDIGALLHKLKGSSGNVRLNQMMELAVIGETAYNAGELKTIGSILAEMEHMLLAIETASHARN